MSAHDEFERQLRASVARLATQRAAPRLRRPQWRPGVSRLVLAATVVVSVAVAGYALTTLRHSPPSSPPPAGTRTTHNRAPAGDAARNKAAAAADAKHLVALVNLPPGSIRSATEPKGDNGLLRAKGHLGSGLGSRVAHAWYIVPAGAPDPQAYLQQHPPGGGTMSGGVGTNLGTITGGASSSTTLFYTFPDTQHVFSRTLEVTFTTFADGKTGVLIAARSNWRILPRPSSEKVPAKASQVRISAAIGTKRATYPAITSKDKVRKLIEIVDSPPIVQQSVYSGCRSYTGKPHILMVRFTNTHGRALAEAYVSWAGNETVGNRCNPINFKLGNKTQPALVDPHFLSELETVTGLKLG